jgi:hypothetical protein
MQTVLYPLTTSSQNANEVQKGFNDWSLYLSPEGFPYYYNHQTGQSEWALFESPGSPSESGHIFEPIVAAMISVPSPELAETMSRDLVQQKLVACAQILPSITSVYSWKGNIEEAKEVMMVVKVIASGID